MKRKKPEPKPVLLTEEQFSAVQDSFDAQAYSIIALFQKARRDGKQEQARALWDLWRQFRANEREFHAEQRELQDKAEAQAAREAKQQVTRRSKRQKFTEVVELTPVRATC